MTAKKTPNVERRLSTDPRRCPACRGTGKNGRDQACGTCGGSGTVSASVTPIQRPGELVTRSGVYEVRHGTAHEGESEQALQHGSIFPRCAVCGLDVSYRLLRSAPVAPEDLQANAKR